MSRYDEDFEKRFVKGYSLVTISVIYYMPDYRSVLNEFIWQTLDIKPNFPRIHSFLDYWRREINAIIKEVRLAEDNSGIFRPLSVVTAIH